MSKIIEQNISFLFDREIWKLVFDPVRPFVAVELRSEDAKTVKFVCLDYDNRTVLSEILIEDQWWVSLVAVSDGLIILQKYKDEKFPQPQGFLVYKAKTGHLLYEEKEYNFDFFSADGLVASMMGFEQLSYLKLLAAGDSLVKESIELSTVRNLLAVEPEILFPQQYLEGDEHFNTVKMFVNQCAREVAVESLEYVETPSFIIVSYYIRASKKIENYLLITTSEGEVKLNELINSKQNGIGRDTFLVKENQLFYIKDKKEIHSYVL